MKTALFCLLLIFSIVACEKESSEKSLRFCTIVPGNVAMIKSERYREFEKFYFYDDNRIITKIITNNSLTGLSDTSLYTVYDDSVRVNGTDTSYVIRLNRSSLLEGYFGDDIITYDSRCFKVYWKDNLSGATDYAAQDSFHNDGLNYLNQEKGVSGLLRIILYKINFMYDKTKVNTFGNHNHGMPYYGSSSYNLLTKSAVDYKIYGTWETDTLTNSYEFDSNNRVSKAFTKTIKNYAEYITDTLTTYYTYY